MTLYEIMGVSRGCSFLSATGLPKHCLDADLALCESLLALVWRKTSVLAGDFNCRGVNQEAKLAEEEGLRLLNFKQDNFLSQ